MKKILLILFLLPSVLNAQHNREKVYLKLKIDSSVYYGNFVAEYRVSESGVLGWLNKYIILDSIPVNDSINWNTEKIKFTDFDHITLTTSIEDVVNTIEKYGIYTEVDVSVKREYIKRERRYITRDLDPRIVWYADLRNTSKIVKLSGMVLISIPFIYDFLAFKGVTIAHMKLAPTIILGVSGGVLGLSSWIIDWIAISKLRK